jgi:nucleotide-binding universal stress UspA family protein
MIQIRRILVPTDFSPPALTALAYAKTLAAEFGSRLYLLHVIATPDVPWGAEGATYSWPTLLADIEKDVRAQFQHLIPPDDPLANQVTMETMINVPVDGILDYTETHQIWS